MGLQPPEQEHWLRSPISMQKGCRWAGRSGGRGETGGLVRWGNCNTAVSLLPLTKHPHGGDAPSEPVRG